MIRRPARPNPAAPPKAGSSSGAPWRQRRPRVLRGLQRAPRRDVHSILTAQDVGSYKPSPRNFQALTRKAQRLGIGDGRLLHVAQSLFHDHVPAKAAGLPTVWIDGRHDNPGWGATPAPPTDVTRDWTFSSMAAFADAADAAAVRA